ncbi:hypothetical protein [Nocardia cyriacigeorgica]|uniref:hypothetical protein n=1 Tax=Nocardia cyriacigeorgica TaxID=135487 RepID=UPI002455906F|nr:hypothetical protein [Nocardia cyriacigeorgica]
MTTEHQRWQQRRLQVSLRELEEAREQYEYHRRVVRVSVGLMVAGPVSAIPVGILASTIHPAIGWLALGSTVAFLYGMIYAIAVEPQPNLMKGKLRRAENRYQDNVLEVD